MRTKTTHEPTTQRSRDFLERPSRTGVWWGLPLLAGFTTNFLQITEAARLFVWAGAFAWMGVGCALNARSCHRLHCYFAAPVLFVGAVAAVAAGVGFGPLGPDAAAYVVNATLWLALLTFLAESIWGRYRGH